MWVDGDDKVWVSEWSANAIVRFDPLTESFESLLSDRPNSDVRQMLGRKDEVWIAESGTDRLRVIRRLMREPQEQLLGWDVASAKTRLLSEGAKTCEK